jgi:hypothetical protein
MAWTQLQIDALKAAISTGVLTVKHGETLTTYRSLDEMKQLLAMMETDVATGGRVRRVVATYRGGA